MDPDSQTDKPPQSDFQGFTNVLGTFIALVTLITPLASIVIFSSPIVGSEQTSSSVSRTLHLSLSLPLLNTET
ncbi:MAG: hypothetical protein AAGD25_34680 [Cyanobacteria bacterium P01_F01_bin.150]